MNERLRLYREQLTNSITIYNLSGSEVAVLCPTKFSELFDRFIKANGHSAWRKDCAISGGPEPDSSFVFESTVTDVRILICDFVQALKSEDFE